MEGAHSKNFSDWMCDLNLEKNALICQGFDFLFKFFFFCLFVWVCVFNLKAFMQIGSFARKTWTPAQRRLP